MLHKINVFFVDDIFFCNLLKQSIDLELTDFRCISLKNHRTIEIQKKIYNLKLDNTLLKTELNLNISLSLNA